MPKVKVTREAWIAALLAQLDQDRIPAEVSLAELSGILEVTKGSFYSHFRDGGLPALHAAVIAQWQRERVAGLPDSTVGAVRDPLDRLRVIRSAAAARPARDGAMRRWAASDRQAAAAVAEADQIITGYLAAALTDLGFSGHEADALAVLLAAALRVGAIAEDPEFFETVLGVLDRAAAASGDLVVRGVPVAAGTELLYAAAGSLSGAQLDALQRIARLFVADQPGNEPGAGQAGQA